MVDGGTPTAAQKQESPGRFAWALHFSLRSVYVQVLAISGSFHQANVVTILTR
jgi:hypothetical protein